MVLCDGQLALSSRDKTRYVIAKPVSNVGILYFLNRTTVAQHCIIYET